MRKSELLPDVITYNATISACEPPSMHGSSDLTRCDAGHAQEKEKKGLGRAGPQHLRIQHPPSLCAVGVGMCVGKQRREGNLKSNFGSDF